MITTRAKITAGIATLIAGAGLTLVLLTGNAGATAPASTSSSTPAGVVVTKSVPVGAPALKSDPNDPRPTATISASAAQRVAQRKDPGVQTSSVAPGVTIAVEPGEAPTATVSATPAAPAGR